VYVKGLLTLFRKTTYIKHRAEPHLEILENRRLLSDPTGTGNLDPESATARQVEYLNRGVVAIRPSTSNAYVGFRQLATDAPGTTFNLYCSIGGAPATQVASLSSSTNFLHTNQTFTQSRSYFVRPVVGGVEQAPSESFTLPANPPVRLFINVPLQVPAGGTTPDSIAYTYNANDASVGDLDGDGDYEIILKWDPTNSKDNSQSGYTGNVYIDAYDFNGQGGSTRLWRIDLGRNVRAGAHYSPFLVYDFDGDGKAEVVTRTAEATIDGTGVVLVIFLSEYLNSYV
jgi:hypothetical protein